MDGCVLLTSTPECVVSPRRAIPRAQPEGSPRGETTHEGVDVNNTHPSMINPLNHFSSFMWDIITQPCTNCVGDWVKLPLKLGACRSKYTQLFYENVVTYPDPNPDAGISNRRL